MKTMEKEFKELETLYNDGLAVKNKEDIISELKTLMGIYRYKFYQVDSTRKMDACSKLKKMAKQYIIKLQEVS